jgi:hypothetical protein
MRIATALFQRRLRALFRAVKRAVFARNECRGADWHENSAASSLSKIKKPCAACCATQVRFAGPFSSRNVNEINFGSGSISDLRRYPLNVRFALDSETAAG